VQSTAARISNGTLEGLDGSSDAFKVLGRGMVRMLKDKVAGVFQAALKVLRELVGCQVRDFLRSLPIIVKYNGPCGLKAWG
jgi:hypothetical protein